MEHSGTTESPDCRMRRQKSRRRSDRTLRGRVIARRFVSMTVPGILTLIPMMSPFMRNVWFGKVSFRTCKLDVALGWLAKLVSPSEENSGRQTHCDHWGGKQAPREKFQKDDNNSVIDARLSEARCDEAIFHDGLPTPDYHGCNLPRNFRWHDEGSVHRRQCNCGFQGRGANGPPG